MSKPLLLCLAAISVIAGLTALALTRAIPGEAALISEDLRVHDWFLANRVEWLTFVMRGVSHFAAWGTVTAVVIGGVLFALKKRRVPDAILLVAATLGAEIVSSTIKRLIRRERPDLENRVVTVATYSFPSGHSIQAVAFYGVLALLVWRLNIVRRRAVLVAGVVAMSLLIGLSRIYLGVHWPTDVVAGWLVGACWLAFAWGAIRTYEARHRKVLEA